MDQRTITHLHNPLETTPGKSETATRLQVPTLRGRGTPRTRPHRQPRTRGRRHTRQLPVAMQAVSRSENPTGSIRTQGAIPTTHPAPTRNRHPPHQTRHPRQARTRTVRTSLDKVRTPWGDNPRPRPGPTVGIRPETKPNSSQVANHAFMALFRLFHSFARIDAGYPT